MGKKLKKNNKQENGEREKETENMKQEKLKVNENRKKVVSVKNAKVTVADLSNLSCEMENSSILSI